MTNADHASTEDTSLNSTTKKSIRDDSALEQPTEPTAAAPAAQGVEEKTTGAPLDKTPSQAAKMGKKKIIAVMAALCVRYHNDLESPWQ